MKLVAGCSIYSKNINPECKLIGVEPETCPSMLESVLNDKLVELNITDNFVDGATVSKVDITFEICKKNLDKVENVSIGKICETMLELYQNDGIIAEPAGALPVSLLTILNLKLKIRL